MKPIAHKIAPVLWLVGSFASVATTVVCTGAEPLSFNRDIRPILSETCFVCHGPDDHGRQAGLRLDSAESATVDLGGYQPIVPGDLDASEAWLRIISDDPELQMPPPDSNLALTEGQKQTIARWIREGAPYEDHWAFQPIQRTALPTEVNSDSSVIDAWVSLGLKDGGLVATMEASPRTLIRRLSFDLTGLPPTVEEVRKFESDYSRHPQVAWQETIERLLSSRHYGERMAVAWLDQARYADTNGYSIDGGRDMWLWRDWVIEAYNRNLPLDQFITEQLAGDLLPDATDAQRIASGFNRNHMNTHEGGTIPEENLANYVADRVKTTSEVFMGLTMGCAQCHDHKYDPISQKEYYEFFAFFNELSDKGLDGNSGVNSSPSMVAKTVLPLDELDGLRSQRQRLVEALSDSDVGLSDWLTKIRTSESARGEGFKLHPVEMLDASSPNTPGPFEIQADGSILVSAPSGGLNGFSHAIRLPDVERIDGLRINFLPKLPDASKPDSLAKLTPFTDGVPKITTVLISSGDQAAKQVDIYRQVAFSQATASSFAAGHSPSGVLDERNDAWWQPADSSTAQYLTLRFSEPIATKNTPYLSVMIFFGVNESLASQWKLEAFEGRDPDTDLPSEITDLLAIPEADWNSDQQATMLSAYQKLSPELAPLRVEIANFDDRISVLTESFTTMVMDTSAQPRETFVLDRGQYDARLEKVSKNVPRVLPALPSAGDAATRLDLAQWLVSPEHPLTARVMVNRLWSIFFGQGLVASSADFGSQGEYPSHPELLDDLALELIENGWDQKAIIRRIVSSETYRRDSATTARDLELDPQNRRLARGSRFRLSAEMIRDTALATSGLLVDRIGGPSVHPYQPAGLWKEISHFGSTPATRQVFVADRGEKLYRRSLYTTIKRTSPHPAMSAFDAPNREMCTVQRGITNTPLQALVTLNDPQFAEAARVLAARIITSLPSEDSAARLDYACELVIGRPPNDLERTALLQFLDVMGERFKTDSEAAKLVISIGESPVVTQLDPAELAAWTQVASLLLNLSETLTRN